MCDESFKTFDWFTIVVILSIVIQSMCQCYQLSTRPVPPPPFLQLLSEADFFIVLSIWPFLLFSSGLKQMFLIQFEENRLQGNCKYIYIKVVILHRRTAAADDFYDLVWCPQRAAGENFEEFEVSMRFSKGKSKVCESDISIFFAPAARHFQQIQYPVRN